jgi:hypothetical protein
MRDADPDAACDQIGSRLMKGEATPASVWDAVHLASAELRMRARSGAALAAVHAVTSANALHHACDAAPDPQTRYLMTLQAVGWMGQFLKWSGAREDALRAVNITDMEPAPEEPTEKAVTETLAGIPGQPDAAAARAFRLARDPAARRAFLAAAIRSGIARGDEVHYYKYLAALVEDVPLVSPEWQPHMVSTIVYYAKGTGDAEPASTKRAREALRAL